MLVGRRGGYGAGNRIRGSWGALRGGGVAGGWWWAVEKPHPEVR